MRVCVNQNKSFRISKNVQLILVITSRVLFCPAMSCPVTRDTELRKLSYHQLHQIARQMNHNKDWQNLMMILPKDLDQDPLTSSTKRFKYTQEHMRMIEEASSTGRRLPAQILFDEWGSSGRKRPNLGHLLDLLVQANLYRAADYLAVDILKGKLRRDNLATKYQ